MHSDTSQANNLFHRLHTYTPRLGRTALEDFCTEALAWCQWHHPILQTCFLEEICRSMGARLGPRLTEYAGKLVVHTQLTYRGEPTDIEADATDAGRFDLVVRSIPDSEFVIVIESKVKIDDGLSAQLKRYRKALSGLAWKNVQERYVVSLTTSSTSLAGADAHLSWHQVHGLLNALSPTDSNPTFVPSNLRQFADFLQTSGLTLTMLDPLTPDQISSFTKSANFFHQGHEFFERFSNEAILKEIFNDRRYRIPRVEFAESDAWYGIHDSQDESYAGFYFRERAMGLCIELCQHGDWTKKLPPFTKDVQEGLAYARSVFNTKPNYDPEKSGTWIRFARPMRNGEQTDEMIRWFARCAAEVKRATQ